MIHREPDRDCDKCPRLAAFRQDARVSEPGWFNAPVPTLGGDEARLLVVGLAPGLRGANRTGRPFTGDYAGDLLYATLLEQGLATGHFDRDGNDDLALADCALTNAVRCVPPQNKPMPEEIRTCRVFLTAQVEAMTRLRAVVALGRIAHESVLRLFGTKLSAAPFVHGRRHRIARPDGAALALFDSYHCSRYNTNTGLLTTAMFRDVFAAVRDYLNGVD